MKMNGLIRSHWASFLRAFRRNPRRSWYQLKVAVRVTVQIALSMWRANMYSHKIQTQLARQRQMNELLESMLSAEGVPSPSDDGPAEHFKHQRMFYCDPKTAPKYSPEV